MKVYLSHITALRFWRAWSILRPLTLQEFHSTGKVADANLFPSNIYQTSAVLRDCAIRECDIHGLFDELPEMPELRFCLKDCTDGLGAKPWHILHDGKEGTKSSMLAERHRSLLNYPRGSFVRIAEGLFVCSPELVFVQMASCLSFGELLALGYELCGCYPRSTQKSVPLVRRPLTTPNRLMAYAARLNGAKGAKLARAVAKQVRAKSGSVMETELAAIAFTAEVYGVSVLPKRSSTPPLPCRRRRAGLLVPIGLCSIFTGPRRISALNTMGVLPMRAPISRIAILASGMDLWLTALRQLR